MGRLTADQIAVIKNDYEEKGWTAYRIWQEHPRFQCSRNTVEKLIRKIKETGSGERREGSGRPISATTDENADECEECIKLALANYVIINPSSLSYCHTVQYRPSLLTFLV